MRARLKLGGRALEESRLISDELGASMQIERRTILRAALGSAALAAMATSAERSAASGVAKRGMARPPVRLVGDDAALEPEAMSTRLSKLASEKNVADSYLKGGAVAELESRFADILGKEACIFLPTGTLANNVALRALCGENPRALCQFDSHLYRDESDAVQRVSGINLVPLAAGRAVPTMEELAAAFDTAEKGPYPLKVGAISLESPVRRLNGEMIPPAEIAKIADLARKHGAAIHLDGARLLLAPPQIDIRAYAAPFDTVYVSLYKYLGAPFGAVLAGQKARIDEVREDRHLFGSLIYQGWIPAVLALDRLGSIRADMAKAYAAADALTGVLEQLGIARLRTTKSGSNIYLLQISEDRASAALIKGRASGIQVGTWKDGLLPLGINHTILRRPVSEYVRLFQT